MIQLTFPWMLLLLAAIPAALWSSSRRQPAFWMGSIDALAQAAAGGFRSRRWILAEGLRAGWLALLVLALTGPRTGRPGTEIRRSGLALSIVLDVSGSMGTVEAVGPSGPVRRLDQARGLLRKILVDEPEVFLASARLSAVAAGSRPTLVAPPTRSAGALLEMLDQLQIDRMDNRTNLGDALASAVDRLRRETAGERAILLLTDGANTYPEGMPPQEAARIAQSLGIRLIIVGFGSPTTAVSPETFRVEQSRLRQWADWTGGAFFELDQPGRLPMVLRDVQAGLAGPVEVVGYRRWRDWAPETILAAMTVWLLESILTRTWLRVEPM